MVPLAVIGSVLSGVLCIYLGDAFSSTEDDSALLGPRTYEQRQRDLLSAYAKQPLPKGKDKGKGKGKAAPGRGAHAGSKRAPGRQRVCSSSHAKRVQCTLVSP